ncbi:sugar ABC transporter permease [Paenibacillus sp. PK4536]|uniref:Sugar ABC transporter permease n=2 Tax=Paenibacillus TaxID=44249 RepID=A0AAX3M6M9_9BACL|nr:MULTISPECIES: sugar ABC transporter permease [Paenibacillus]MDN4619985.1 sugar ABC transporter permease [Paenibacillus sp. PsM32]MDQ1233951.1 arabinogalactan oligomer/maltooligosaccharide transport system permease protein [Paenibacillus sp. SORGH_AS_0306]MDR6110996.1 arabinogalactan oligomer/maltooligosaccharide transport system permease protein [Paenibacillus sp. SORGH_AS_0338]ODP27742.1 putative arabinogalactan oligomer transport system permease protein GanQ [Paenibacillus nuruki]TKJ87729
MRKQQRVKLVFSYILLVLIAIGCIYPALWIILSSLKEGDSLYSETLIPQKLTLEHYMDLFRSQSDKDLPYLKWYWNTLKIAITSMILGTLFQVLTAYAMSRFRFKGRQTMMSLVLILGMFPGFMSMIAVYVILLQMNLLNSPWALVLVYTSGAALGMFVAKGFFDTIPRALEESALLDGASHFQIFSRIILPLSMPIITYIALTTFAGAWVDFIFARLILRSRENWTLAVGLYELVNTYSSTEFTLFAAGSVLVALPITLLYMFLQRFLVHGLTAGATKG